MSIPKLPMPKDPDDVTDFTVSFAEALPSDDVVIAVEPVIIEVANLAEPPPSSAPDLACASVLWSGQLVTLWLSGGRDQWRYQIGVIVHTQGGRKLHRRALLQVGNQ